MKEVFVNREENAPVTQVTKDTPIPTPKPHEVVIKVVTVGLNPKDWKYAKNINNGDDIAGYIHAVGSDVRDFRPGDRVMAYHDMLEAHGGYAEYAIAETNLTVHLPEKISFEEAATIPLPALTAALALFQELDFPYPWKPARAPVPLIVYGGSSVVGANAIKLASLANIHPIITVAGGGGHAVTPLLDPSKGDVLIDYRNGHEATVKGIKDALKGQEVHQAVDAVSMDVSYDVLEKVVVPGGTVATVGPPRKDSKVNFVMTFVKSVCSDVNSMRDNKKLGTVGYRDFGATFFKLIGRGLDAGWFKGHPHRIVPDGLDGIAKALNEMKDGKVSAFRYVARIADTPALKQ